MSVVVVASLAAAVVTWRGSPVAAIGPVLGCALVITVVVLIRRALRRASVLIDAILRDELDIEPTVSAVEDDRANRNQSKRYSA